MVRAKFKLFNIESYSHTQGQRFEFTAVSNDGTPENQRFNKYSRSGTMSFFVDNPAAQEQFKLGDEYYFDIRPAVPTPA